MPDSDSAAQITPWARFFFLLVSYEYVLGHVVHDDLPHVDDCSPGYVGHGSLVETPQALLHCEAAVSVEDAAIPAIDDLEKRPRKRPRNEGLTWVRPPSW